MPHKDSRGFTGFFICNCPEHAYHSNCNGCNCQMNTCPACGYDGKGMCDGRYGYQKHTKQLNPQNPYELICGNCSEAFKLK